MKSKRIIFMFVLCIWMLSSVFVQASTTNKMVRIPKGSIYYIEKNGKEITGINTAILKFYDKNSVIALKKGTAIIRYKKKEWIHKVQVVVGKTKGYHINKHSGTYDMPIIVKIRVKNGYTLYYSKKNNAEKFYKIKSGQFVFLHIDKDTMLKVQVIKNTKNISKNYLIKNQKNAFCYDYKIKQKEENSISPNVDNAKKDFVESTESSIEKNLLSLKVALSETEYDYDKQKHIPDVIIKDGSYILIEEKDYDITAPVSVKAGSYYVIVHGKGNYSGSIKLAYQIKNSLISWYEVLDYIGEELAQKEFTYSNKNIKNTWKNALDAENKVCNCASYICYSLQILKATAGNGFKGQIYSAKTGLVLKSGASLGTNLKKIITNGKTPWELEAEDILKEGDICLFWLPQKNIGHMAVYGGKDIWGNLLWYNGGKDAVEGKTDGGTYVIGGVGPSDSKTELLTGKVLMILRIINFSA